MKKNLIIFLSISILGTLVLVFKFFDISKSSTAHGENLPLTGYSKDLNFKPDSVIEFKYNVFDEEYLFRKNRVGGEWNGPKHSSLSIQDRLIFLSSVDVYPIDRFSGNVIKLKIKFSTQEVWNIISNGHLIRFEDGPLAGKGGRLNQKNRMLFSSGKFAFSDRKIHWCSSKLTGIKIKESQLVKINGLWTKLSNKKNKRSEKDNVNQSQITQWLDKNCFIYSQANLDKRLIRDNLDHQIKFKFKENESGNDKFVNIKWSDNFIVNIGNEINPIYNKELVAELNELKNVLQ